MTERLSVHDGLFDARLVAQAASSWPSADWPHWFRYDAEDERKRTCQDYLHMPLPCQQLLEILAQVPVPWAGAFADRSLRGGGMHDMRDGDFLNLHLDADRPLGPDLLRVGNGILFLDGPAMGDSGGLFASQGIEVAPRAGRLLLFSCTDDATHCVSAVRWQQPRKTLALFWYAAIAGATQRPRALFVDDPGSPTGPEVTQRRRRRAGLRVDQSAG